jgi:BMFP domain-containing protein YqiC
MINSKLLEGISEQIGQLFDQAGQSSADGELKPQIKALLQGTFSRMELVTREEFDAQSAVLARTRMKLEQLQLQLDQLENAARPDR